jgi:hypothetical protein
MELRLCVASTRWTFVLQTRLQGDRSLPLSPNRNQPLHDKWVIAWLGSL